jgi:hypothetical protein
MPGISEYLKLRLGQNHLSSHLENLHTDFGIMFLEIIITGRLGKSTSAISMKSIGINAKFRKIY